MRPGLFSPRSAVGLYIVCFAASLSISALAGFAYVISGQPSVDEARSEQIARDRTKVDRRTAALAARDRARSPTVIARLPDAIAGADPKLAAVGPDSQAELAALPAGNDDDPDASTVVWSSKPGTWRTVCVRLCVGAFTPVSFATTRDRFKADSARCEADCASPARLFVMKPDGQPEDLVDLAGNAYTALPTAFQFRTTYDAACTCRGPAQVRQQVASLSRPPRTAPTDTPGLSSDVRDERVVQPQTLQAPAWLGSSSREHERTRQAGVASPIAQTPIVEAMLAVAAVRPQAPSADARSESDAAGPLATREAHREPVRGAARGADSVRVDSAVPVQGQGAVTGDPLIGNGRPRQIASAAQTIPSGLQPSALNPPSETAMTPPSAMPAVATPVEGSKIASRGAGSQRVVAAGGRRPIHKSTRSNSAPTYETVRIDIVTYELARLGAPRRPPVEAGPSRVGGGRGAMGRAGAQRSFNSPDFWRLSYWHAD